jgi:hypothetical protein
MWTVVKLGPGRYTRVQLPRTVKELAQLWIGLPQAQRPIVRICNRTLLKSQRIDQERVRLPTTSRTSIKDFILGG